MVTGDDLEQEQVGGFSVATTYFSDGNNRYYYRTGLGEYYGATERDIIRRLKNAGFLPFVPKGDAAFVTQVDEHIMTIQDENRVDYAAALAGYRKGLLTTGSDKILITQELKLIDPVAGEWKHLKHLLEGLFIDRDADGKPTCDQLPYVYGWLSIAMEGLYSGVPNKGQALLIAGEPNCGKTLFLKVISYLFGGRIGKPYAFMVGDTKFNDELFESSLLAIDDEADKTDIRSRRHLVAELKKIIAGLGVRCEGKGKKALDLFPHWRIIMLGNLESDNLRVFPPLDGDVIDKLILLKGCRREFTMPTGTQEEKRDFMAQLQSELPAFVHYLLKEHVIPEEYREDRFGVFPYLNHEIVGYMDQVTPWYELLLSLEREFLGSSRLMVETCTGIITRLRDRNSILTQREKDRYTPTSVGKMMAEIAKRRSLRCWQTRAAVGKDRLWVLLRAGETQGEVEAELREKIQTYGVNVSSDDEALYD